MKLKENMKQNKNKIFSFFINNNKIINYFRIILYTFQKEFRFQ